MKSLSLLALPLIFSQSVFSTSLDEILQTPSPMCFRQNYSAEHLVSHPRQSVKAIGLNIYTEDNEARTIHMHVQTELVIRGEARTFTTDMICDRYGESLSCAVECDGGQARVNATESGLELINDGFALNYGCDRQTASEEWLAPSEGGDDKFNLKEVDCSI